jgi:hypothetical protein
VRWTKSWITSRLGGKPRPICGRRKNLEKGLG